MAHLCKDCFHAEFKTTNGRRVLNWGGTCHFEVIITDAYRDVMGKHPEKRTIRGGLGEKCQAWEKKPK